MAKEWAKSFYKSKAWQKCRAGFIQSVYGLCQRCGRPGYIVHHKEVLTPENINDPYVTLNWDKLEYVCLDCHNKEHFSSNDGIRNDVMFDANGDLIKR
jgi:5-methylcytosine-specific restriction endonuclease McrA